MKILRTAESQFQDLPEFPFTPNYVDVQDPSDNVELRMHFIDEGPRDGPVVLMLHGEPTWSYLYRHMIPVFVEHGYRAVVPDLIGFGRSDKPTQQSDYTYARHVDWLSRFLHKLELNAINLVCQDWGSLIGLRIAAEQPDLFARIALANGGLPTGDQTLPPAFHLWKAFARFSPVFPIGKIISKGCVSALSAKEIAAYDAPFPGNAYKAGARMFPKLVPSSPNDPATEANRAAWEVFKAWDKPFLTAFSDKDPITRGGARPFQNGVPGARDVNHVQIKSAGHFLQEDKGVELADAVIRFIQST